MSMKIKANIYDEIMNLKLNLEFVYFWSGAQKVLIYTGTKSR